jgi:hypothetical protein
MDWNFWIQTAQEATAMESGKLCCWVLLCEHQENPGRHEQLSQAKKVALEVWANAVYGDYFSN